MLALTPLVELGGERKRDDRLTGRAASYVAVNARVASPKPLNVGQNSKQHHPRLGVKSERF